MPRSNLLKVFILANTAEKGLILFASFKPIAELLTLTRKVLFV